MGTVFSVSPRVRSALVRLPGFAFWIPKPRYRGEAFRSSLRFAGVDVERPIGSTLSESARVRLARSTRRSIRDYPRILSFKDARSEPKSRACQNGTVPKNRRVRKKDIMYDIKSSVLNSVLRRKIDFETSSMMFASERRRGCLGSPAVRKNGNGGSGRIPFYPFRHLRAWIDLMGELSKNERKGCAGRRNLSNMRVYILFPLLSRYLKKYSAIRDKKSYHTMCHENKRRGARRGLNRAGRFARELARGRVPKHGE